MKQYLKELAAISFGTWEEDFKVVIEKANPNFEQDFNQIVMAIPPEDIPNFLEWMVNIGNTDLIIENVDYIMQSIVNYQGYTKNWVLETTTLLADIKESNIDESISANLMQIINGPYKRGNLWSIFYLCEECKKIEKAREIIEQNYGEIIDVIFSNNEFLSKNEEKRDQIKKLIYKLAEQEKVRLSDIEHIGSGQYSECIRIGESVLKFGKKRRLQELPVHKRILQPKLRRNIPQDYEEKMKSGILREEDILAIECQDVVDENWYEGLSDEEIKEKLYLIWKDLRREDIIWTDIKAENVGRLLKPNVVEYTIKDTNGEEVKRQEVLPIGSLAVFDTDRIYSKEKLPKFDISNDEECSYENFEKRFCEERKEERDR